MKTEITSALDSQKRREKESFESSHRFLFTHARGLFVLLRHVSPEAARNGCGLGLCRDHKRHACECMFSEKLFKYKLFIEG